MIVSTEALREHKMRSRFKDDEDLIFPNSMGGPMDGHNMVNRHFRPTLKKAGLPKIRWHDLRHTFATLLLQKRVPVTVVSKTLGHASAKMTLDTYSHVIAEDLDDAAAAMEAVLLGTDAKAVGAGVKAASVRQASGVDGGAIRVRCDADRSGVSLVTSAFQRIWTTLGVRS